MASPRQLAGTAVAGLRMRHPLGRALLLRDLTTFLRLDCLGALSMSGLAAALRQPGTAAQLAERAGVVDVELTTAVLDLAVAQRQVRRRGELYRVRGRRLRAIASGRAPDAAGVAEEATSYTGPIWANVVAHLNGAPPAGYDDELGDVIAKVSRLVEPVVGPWLADATRHLRPRRVLDVGCGSGVYLRWLARAAPDGATLTGVDVSPDAAASARANLAAWGLEHITVVDGDVLALPQELTAEPWDLVLLAHNIYYWPVEERAGVLARLRDLAGPEGTVIALTPVPGRIVLGRSLDVALRVTTGCARLPTRDELVADARKAGFTSVRVSDIVPGSGAVALVARR